jgi:hypothetical protein
MSKVSLSTEYLPSKTGLLRETSLGKLLGTIHKTAFARAMAATHIFLQLD